MPICSEYKYSRKWKLFSFIPLYQANKYRLDDARWEHQKFMPT